MISRALLNSKVRRLEERFGPRDALLRFINGSTRTIFVRDPLAIFCDAMNLVWYVAHGRFQQPPADIPKVPERRLQLINLIAQATEIETNDVFFQQILAVCRETRFFDGCASEEECTERYVARQQKFKAAQFVGGNDEEH